ncbi:MAG: AarF/ABC1/UbiB kinase family protein [Nanoarchaeota archaeon]
MKLNPRKDFRDLARFNKIMLISTQQGFGFLFDKIKVPFRKKTKIEEKNNPKRLRKTLEKLGPTFVKLGQILSLRPDLIPKEYVRELSDLQDKVPPFPYDEVEKIIQAELHHPIIDLFQSFNKKPIASASISQVHKAKLKDGTIVAVKVQRPAAEEIMKIDIEIMFYLAKILESHSKVMQRYNPVKIIKEFEEWTKKELNFKVEAQNAKRFYRNFKNSATVKIPKIFDEYSTQKVLAMEFIDGIPLHSLDKVKGKKGYNMKEIMKNGFDSILNQIFIHGFFHADPHPGNILVLKGNKIAWIDFGIVGTFNKYLKQKSIDLLYGLVEEDIDSITETFLDMGLINEKKTDIDLFKEEVRDAVEPLQNSKLKDIKISYVLESVLDIALKHHVKMPTDFVLSAKTLLELEGMGLEFIPSFKLVDATRPFLEKLIKREFKITYMAKDLMKNMAKYSRLFREFPDQLSSALRKIQKGTIKVDIEDTDVKRLATDIDKSSNRITYGMLIAAFLITGALLVNVGSPILSGFPLSSLICFALAVIFALVLFVSIEKEQK